MNVFQNNRQIFAFFTGNHSEHGFFITNDNKVYGFGENSDYQLGLGSKDHKYFPEEIPFFRSTSPIIQISVGCYHSLFVSSNGKPYGCGDYSFGVCGINHKQKLRGHFPRPIDFFKFIRVVKTGCGYKHSVFLTRSRKCYGGGKSVIFQPILINIPENVIDIKCGGEFSVFLTNQREVYATGSNSYNQLGKDSPMFRTPKKVKFPIPVKIKYFGCGWNNIMFVSKDNRIFGSGSSSDGQLGGFQDKRVVEELRFNLKVSSVTVGAYHSFLKDEKKVIYGMGYDEHGEIAAETKSSRKDVPVRIKGLSNKNIVQTETGVFQSYHISNDSEIYASGSNNYGSLFGQKKEEKYCKIVWLTEKKKYNLKRISYNDNESEFQMKMFSNLQYLDAIVLFIN